MANRTEEFELTGIVHTVAGRQILVFDQPSSDRLPSRGQVALDLLDEFDGTLVVVDPDGRKGHWLAINTPAGLSVDAAEGQEITVKARKSTQWPEAVIPQDLAGALQEAVDLEDTWESLTPMARWEWVRWVGATKNEDTRARRVEVSISKLRDGKRRPCCFDLSSCTDAELAKSGKLAL